MRMQQITRTLMRYYTFLKQKVIYNLHHLARHTSGSLLRTPFDNNNNNNNNRISIAPYGRNFRGAGIVLLQYDFLDRKKQTSVFIEPLWSVIHNAVNAAQSNEHV